MQKSFLFVFTVAILLIVGYVMNIVKLVNCDFDAPYKCEVFRSIGAITGLGGVIGYFPISE